MRILIVEDEYNLADLVKDRLEKEKYIVDVFNDGEEGLDEALTGIYDLIILDVMLPHVDGFEILKQIRENNINSKVIILTAKSEIEDKLEGLTNGADDYVTKPFHIEELVARVNVRLSNSNIKSNLRIIKFNDLTLYLDSSKLECSNSGDSIDLIKKEFLLLEYFMNNANQLLSRDQILEKIWGLDNMSESNNIEAYISFIRKKMKAIGSNSIIKSVRGLGYKLEVNDE